MSRLASETVIASVPSADVQLWNSLRRKKRVTNFKCA